MRLLSKLLGEQARPQLAEENSDDDLDDGECENLISKDYISIINSSKYADSNANTKQLQRLLSLIDMNKDEIAEEVLPVEHDETREDDGEEHGASIESIICHEADEVLPGQPCYKPAKFGKEGGQNFTLGKFDVPRRIMHAIKANDVELLQLSSPMTMDNYVNRFQALLWIEEARTTYVGVIPFS